MLLLEAIAHEEGFYAGPQSRPFRNLNPGDLEYGPEAQRFGATRGDPRFAVFPDLATGWKALARWLSIPAKFDTKGNLVGGYLGATLRQVIFRFAPPGENDPQQYLDYVCLQTGLSPDAVLTAAMLGLPTVS